MFAILNKKLTIHRFLDSNLKISESCFLNKVIYFMVRWLFCAFKATLSVIIKILFIIIL